MQLNRSKRIPLEYDLPGTLAVLRAKAQLRHKEIATLIDARAETIARWNNVRSRIPNPTLAWRLTELEYLVDEVSEHFKPEEAREWLFSPLPGLDGAVPADLFRTGRTHEALQVLSQMRQKKERARRRQKQYRRPKPAPLPPLPENWRSPLLNPPQRQEKT
jgi:hypothetical protein